MQNILWYAVAVFIIVLISGCSVNLFKKHYIFQLTGITFFLTYLVFKSMFIIKNDLEVSVKDLYFNCLPALSGMCACLVSMVLGFWMFPFIRKRIKD